MAWHFHPRCALDSVFILSQLPQMPLPFALSVRQKGNLRNEILLLWDEKKNNPQLVLNDTDLSLRKLNKSVLGRQNKQWECNSQQGVRWPFVQLRDRFSKALHPRYTKCKHPAPDPATSVLVTGVQQRNVALVTHTASGPSEKNKMIKSVFIPLFVRFYFSFACHGQRPMETHRLLHNSYYFPQNPVFHLKTTPPKRFYFCGRGSSSARLTLPSSGSFSGLQVLTQLPAELRVSLWNVRHANGTAEGRVKIFTIFPLHILNPPPPFDTETTCARELQDSCTENKAWKFPKLWLQICFCPPQCVHEQHSMSHSPLPWKASCNMDVAVMDLSGELCSDCFFGGFGCCSDKCLFG